MRWVLVALLLGCDDPIAGTVACQDFAEVVCDGLVDFIPDCVQEVTKGWEWTDEAGRVRLLGGCGDIKLVSACYAESSMVVEATLGRVLHLCSSYDGFAEDTR